MKFIDNIKAKREIKRILNSADSDKVESVGQIKEDEEIQRIILSIEDKQKRAKAFEQNIGKIDDKDVLKKIIPTLKDDDILKLLKRKERYLNNEERNILYTTIKGIGNLDKRINAIDIFKYSLPDHELSVLLADIKDKTEENKYENKKIDISADKIIDNYINYGTIMHIDYLTWHLQNESSKLKVLQKCIERSNGIEKRNHTLFNAEAKINLTEKIFGSIVKKGKNNGLDRKKVEIVFNMFKNNEISYEQARGLVEKHIYNEAIVEQTKKSLLKQEAKKIKIQKDTETKTEQTPENIGDDEEVIR